MISDKRAFNLLFGSGNREKILASDPTINEVDWVDAGLDWLKEHIEKDSFKPETKNIIFPQFETEEELLDWLRQRIPHP